MAGQFVVAIRAEKILVDSDGKRIPGSEEVLEAAHEHGRKVGVVSDNPYLKNTELGVDIGNGQIFDTVTIPYRDEKGLKPEVLYERALLELGAPATRALAIVAEVEDVVAATGLGCMVVALWTKGTMPRELFTHGAVEVSAQHEALRRDIADFLVSQNRAAIE